MRIAITGASGFVGTAVVATLQQQGHDVVRLVRRPEPAGGTARWDATSGQIDTAALGAIDAVVHLAGENVAGGRWSKARKHRIHQSRGPATQALCRTLAALPQPPRVLVAASAIGIYGERGDDVVDEQSPPGDDFLAGVATAWEAGAEPLRAAGARVVHLRIPMVLDPSGGALQRMLLPFRLGIGGPLGSGRQWMGWITRHDLVRVITTALTDARYRGPVLATTPNPVTNREFVRALGKALHRPAVLPAPTFALRLLLGEMSDLLLRSQRPRPGVLLANGFAYEHPELAGAFAAMFAPRGRATS